MSLLSLDVSYTFNKNFMFQIFVFHRSLFPLVTLTIPRVPKQTQVSPCRKRGVRANGLTKTKRIIRRTTRSVFTIVRR